MTERERLLKVLDKTIAIKDENTDDYIEWLADELLANGIILMPCKFLQNCFVIPTIENNLTDITEMKCIGFSFSHDSYNANLITDKNKLYQPCFGAFGKTVFLTREEAEKALGETK